MEHFVIIVNDYKSLTIITTRSILNVAAVPDPPLGPLLFQIFLNDIFLFISKCQLCNYVDFVILITIVLSWYDR